MRLSDRIHRRKRSLLFRAQAVNRHVRNSLKRFYRTTPLRRLAISETGVRQNSKAEFLRSGEDATWYLAPRTTVPCPLPRAVAASAHTENHAALKRSLLEQHFDAPEIVLGRFHDCIADPQSIRLVTRDCGFVAETSSIHDLLDPSFVASGHLTNRRQQLHRVIYTCEKIDEDVLFAFNSFTSSYGHFTLTSLPLIFAFMDEVKQGRLKIVMPKGLPRWIESHFLELGLDSRHFLMLGDAAYQFRSAIASNILDAGNTRAPNPASLAWVPEILRLTEAASAPGKKLYVKRSISGNVSSRQISNEGELIGALNSLGFHAIEPGTLSLREQARAFHGADIIVSPHGSTLANLVFCRPGTRVLDLMPDSWVGVRGDSIRDVWASRMCAVGRLEYSVLICPSEIKARHHTGNPTIEYDVVLADLLATISNL